jgi:hypothetical protein
MSDILYSYFNFDAVKLAFFRVQCWTDKTVKDQVGLKAFGTNLDINAKRLSEKIVCGNYAPQKGFKFYVPKPSRTLRTKTLLNVEDAIVYQAISNKVAEIHQHKLAELDDFVFGSVLAQDVTKGTELLYESSPNYFFFKFWKGLYRKFKDSVLHSIEIDKVKYKFETDITGFFDSIPHYNLLMVLSEQFNVEDEILDLLSDCFNVWSGTRDSLTPGVGIPQGALPSFFFANLILHKLDDQIIGQGFKYYRYMDDIHIYGYEEQELVEALLIIDKYTKGNGLSINSKKTSIQEIEEGKEEYTIKKEIRKLSFFSLYSVNNEEAIREALFGEEQQETENQRNKSKSKIIDKTVSEFSEQDQGTEAVNFWKNVITLDEENEIEAFWLEQFYEVEKRIPELFIISEINDELQLKDEIEDIDLINLSVQYTTSKRALKELGIDKQLKLELIKYWLFAYQKFFWRANNLGITLGAYGINQEIKNALINMYEVDFTHYEWVRYFIIMTLSFNQEFSDKELRQIFFRWLKEQDSDLVKISLYRLLFKHSKSNQFSSSLKKELQKESSLHLKLIIADFNRCNQHQEIDMLEFINTIGL